VQEASGSSTKAVQQQLETQTCRSESPQTSSPAGNDLSPFRAGGYLMGTLLQALPMTSLSYSVQNGR
jgi:hypothetical protein